MIETCSWQMLASLRKRGQRPASGVWVTDHCLQRRNLELSGQFCVMPPLPEFCYLVAGLDVHMIADRNERMSQVALNIAMGHPSEFSVLWRNERGPLEWVIA